MPNPGRLARSIEILKISAHVVMKHKKLIVFPITSGVFIALILAIFFSTSFALAVNGSHWGPMQWSSTHTAVTSPLNVATLFFLYVSFLFSSTFINVAFYHEIMQALAWEHVSIRRGLAFARQRVLAILTWSLFAGTIGFVIRQLAERLGVVGAFILRLVGVTWSVASVFAIPVMIRETSVNPLVLLRQSATTIRKTWGESLIGIIGTDTVQIVLVLLSILVAFSMAFVFGFGSPIAPGVGMAIILGTAVVSQLFMNTVNSVFRCALYIYASEGVVPAPYSPELMESAWRVKKQS